MGGLQHLQLLVMTTGQMLARVVALASALCVAVWLLYLGTLRYRDVSLRRRRGCARALHPDA
jgi:hypothetical protein